MELIKDIVLYGGAGFLFGAFVLGPALVWALS